MFKRILVPLDGSTEAETILSWVQRIAASRSEVHLLHVLPEVHAPVGEPPTLRISLYEQAERYLAGTRERRLSSQAGLELVRSGDPSEEIEKAALEKNIDLIAMTTHGRHGIPRFLLGSVASTIVRKTQLPVLLARPDMLGPSRGIERILVSVEGTQTPRHLLESIKSMASELKSEVVLFHALEAVKDPAPQWAPTLSLVSRPRSESQLLKMADALDEQGYRAWSHVSMGEPAEEIVGQAASLEADLIALSTHGREGLELILEGSVAQKVLHRSAVPVLLQKPVVARNYVPLGESHG